MCGRFTLFSDLNIIFDRFDIGQPVELEYLPRYNIAPSQQILAVVNDGSRNKLGYLRWGLIPSWAKDARIGYKLINARSETILEKPSFKNSFLHRRCLIPADGFYEWKQEYNKKVPVWIHLKNKEPFALAGLWERWISPAGETIVSCTIITTKANDKISSIHERMPVILPRDREKSWLDRGNRDIEYLLSLLEPYPSDMMDYYPVSSQVNSANLDHPDLILPIAK
jgi:putative SOS response-associated peptidase YedK